MTKQERIRGEIKTILRQRYGENWIHNKVALQIVHTLHSQGVVIKVDRELPTHKKSWDSDGEKFYDVLVPITTEDLVEAGCGFFEPLMKEEK